MKNIYKIRLSIAIIIFILSILGLLGLFYIYAFIPKSNFRFFNFGNQLIIRANITDSFIWQIILFIIVSFWNYARNNLFNFQKKK